VVKAMAKDRDQRPVSATAIREALESALEAPSRQRARWKRIASAVLTGLAMAGCALASARWAKTQVSALDAAEAPMAAASTSTSTSTPTPTSTPTSTSTSTSTPVVALPATIVSLSPPDRASARDHGSRKPRR
jgi:hypothetical protein